ncbi:MAG: LLM class flavin-dependent oxidoreductase, partial [Bacteroidota bacterium]
LDVLEYARRADEIGFGRFWLGEHHLTSARLTWSNPLMILPILLQETERIRVGMAGVLINHHTPYTVATNFKLLANLFPERCELGCAAGNFPDAVEREMWHGLVDEVPDCFVSNQERLAAYFNEEQRLLAEERIAIPPVFGLRPDLFALGSSYKRYAWAVEHGMNFVKSAFHSSASLDEDEADRVSRYREAFYARHGRLPRVVMAVAGACRSDAAGLERAQRLVRERATHQKRWRNLIVGPPAEFATRLDELSRRFGADEFVVLDIGVHNAEKIAGLAALREVSELAGGAELLNATRHPRAGAPSFIHPPAEVSVS